MSISRVHAACAALALSSVAVLGTAAPVLAQSNGNGNNGGGNGQNGQNGNNGGGNGNGNGGANCPNPAGNYPPGQCRKGISDNRPQRGENVQASTGPNAFDANSNYEYGVQSTYTRLGSGVTDSTGQATVSFPVPSFLSLGQHNVVFRGIKNGQPTTVRVPFTLVAAPGGNATGTNGTSGGAVGSGTTGSGSTGGGGTVSNGAFGLPRTGANAIVPLSLTGAALVVAGAGMVVVARRRRDGLEVTTDSTGLA